MWTVHKIGSSISIITLLPQKKSKGIVANCFLFVIYKFSSNKILKWSWIPLRYHHQFNFFGSFYIMFRLAPLFSQKNVLWIWIFCPFLLQGSSILYLAQCSISQWDEQCGHGLGWVLMWGPFDIQSKDTTYLFLAKGPNLYFSLFSKFLFAIKINV